MKERATIYAAVVVMWASCCFSQVGSVVGQLRPSAVSDDEWNAEMAKAAARKAYQEKRLQRLEAVAEYLIGTGWEQHADKGAAGIKSHQDAEVAKYAKKLKAERQKSPPVPPPVGAVGRPSGAYIEHRFGNGVVMRDDLLVYPDLPNSSKNPQAKLVPIKD